MPALTSSRLHAVIGSSLRLRDEALATLLAGWNGPIKRSVEPDDLARLVLDLSTASLFEDPALRVLRAGQPYLRKHKPALVDLVGGTAEGGVMVLVCEPPERKDDALFKALAKADALHAAEEPDAKTIVDWLAHRIQAHRQAAERPRPVAEAMVEHLGDDPDALLGALEVLAALRGDAPLDVAAVGELYAGTAARPMWEFSDAVLSGEARRAIGLLHAHGADRPEAALSALLGELRKIAACLDIADDGEAARCAGLRGRPNLYHARRRAREMGQPLVLRLLNGAILASRQFRQSGTSPEVVLETLVLHAQRLIRSRVR